MFINHQEPMLLSRSKLELIKNLNLALKILSILNWNLSLKMKYLNVLEIKHFLLTFQLKQDTIRLIIYFVLRICLKLILMGYYMDSYGLDKSEKRVATALLNGDKIRDFLKMISL